eukprot:1138969-Pelagomonas_calceolata.AAC.7
MGAMLQQHCSSIVATTRPARDALFHLGVATGISDTQVAVQTATRLLRGPACEEFAEGQQVSARDAQWQPPNDPCLRCAWIGRDHVGALHVYK